MIEEQDPSEDNGNRRHTGRHGRGRYGNGRHGSGQGETRRFDTAGAIDPGHGGGAVTGG